MCIRDRIAVRVVLQFRGELSGRAVDGDRFMDVTTLPPCLPPVIQPHLIVRIEVRRSHPTSEMERDSWNTVSGDGGLSGEERTNLRGERCRDPFIGVEGQNPVVGGQAGREVLLIDVTGPWPCVGACAF